MIQVTKLEEKIKEINGRRWYPVEVARVNDQTVRLALFKGEYHWHEHTNEDELFYVVQGSITIQIENNSDLVLNTGDIAAVPKGIKHCPKSSEESYVLMFEPAKLESIGN